MILRYLAAIAACYSSALADTSPVHGQVSAENATTPTAPGPNGTTIHYVTVGKAQNNFYPNSINAAAGDIVSFQFWPANHSVIRAQYGYPCIPYEDVVYDGHGFYSGWQPVSEIGPNQPVWNLTINDTQPVFYCCGAPGSCIDWGMVGVINANSSTPISTQIALAREADFQLIPGEPVPNEKQQASLASLAATATTATLTVTATGGESSTKAPNYSSSPSSTPHHHSSGLSTGATAGIAVGAAIVGIGAAALFFLLRRTHALKKKLAKQEEQQQQQQQPPTGQYPPGGAFSPMMGGFHDQSRHASALPPYYAHETQKDPRETIMSDYSGSPMATPRQPSGNFPPFGLGGHDQRYTQFTSTSELSGNKPTVVELAAGTKDNDDPNSRGYRYS